MELARRRGMMQTSSQPVQPLPAGYTQYDYIQNATVTNNAYLDIQYPASDTDVFDYRIAIDFAIATKNSLSDSCPFGGRPTTSNTVNDLTMYIQKNTTNKVSIHYGGGDTGWQTYDTTQRTVFTFHQGKIYTNGTLFYTLNVSSMVLKSGFPLRLFNRRNGNNNQNQCLIGKIYGFSIKDNNGNYVVNMIPCKNPSNVAGMYDTARNAFYQPNVTMTVGND